MPAFHPVSPVFERSLVEQHGICKKFVQNCLHNCSAQDGHEGLCWSTSCYSVEKMNRSMRAIINVYCFDTQDNVCAPFPDPYPKLDGTQSEDVPIGILVDLSDEPAVIDPEVEGLDTWDNEYGLTIERRRSGHVEALRSVSDYVAERAAQCGVQVKIDNGEVDENPLEEAAIILEDNESDPDADQHQQPPQDQLNIVARNDVSSSVDAFVDAEAGSLSHCDCCKCRLRAQHKWANLSDIEKELRVNFRTISEGKSASIGRGKENHQPSATSTPFLKLQEPEPSFNMQSMVAAIDQVACSSNQVQKDDGNGFMRQALDFATAVAMYIGTGNYDAIAQPTEDNVQDQRMMRPPKPEPARTSGFVMRNSKRFSRGAKFNPFMAMDYNSRTMKWKIIDSMPHFGRISAADRIADSAIEALVTDRLSEGSAQQRPASPPGPSAAAIGNASDSSGAAGPFEGMAADVPFPRITASPTTASARINPFEIKTEAGASVNGVAATESGNTDIKVKSENDTEDVAFEIKTEAGASVNSVAANESGNTDIKVKSENDTEDVTTPFPFGKGRSSTPEDEISPGKIATPFGRVNLPRPY